MDNSYDPIPDSPYAPKEQENDPEEMGKDDDVGGNLA